MGPPKIAHSSKRRERSFPSAERLDMIDFMFVKVIALREMSRDTHSYARTLYVPSSSPVELAGSRLGHLVSGRTDGMKKGRKGIQA